MEYDTLLYTRGYEKDEDYHWVACAEYVNKQEVDALVATIFGLRNSLSDFWNEDSKHVGIFAMYEDFCIFYRAFSSKYNDCFGRVIFAFEGVTCQKKDVNFLYMDIPNIISEWNDENNTIQDMYYNKKMNALIDLHNNINLIDYIFREDVNEVSQLNDYYLCFMYNLQNCIRPQKMIIGKNAGKLALKLNWKSCSVIDTGKKISLDCIRAPEFCKRTKSSKVLVKISGRTDRKGYFSYRWEVFNLDTINAGATNSLILKTNYSDPDSKIEVGELLKEKFLIDRILSAQGYLV